MTILDYIYLHTNKTLILHSIHVFDKWGKNLNHKKMQNNYSNVYPKGQPDPDNQCPDKWSTTVPAIYFNSENSVKSSLKSDKSTVNMSQTEAATNFFSYLSSLHYQQDIKKFL